LKKLVIATRNRKKKKELQSLLRGRKIQLLTLDDFPNTPKIYEDGTTFEANAVKKAVVTSRYTKALTLADDSGLEVAVLGGKPGVRSSRFSGPGANDKRNIRKLLRLMKDTPPKRRKARFVCNVAIAKDGTLLKLVTGTCAGRIGVEPHGSFGFGYDPVFIALGCSKTFAQVGPRIKNTMSHRARALKKARRFIERYFEKDS
jgi:XTP/dITP diphosphohydrolase